MVTGAILGANEGDDLVGDAVGDCETVEEVEVVTDVTVVKIEVMVVDEPVCVVEVVVVVGHSPHDALQLLLMKAL